MFRRLLILIALLVMPGLANARGIEDRDVGMGTGRDRAAVREPEDRRRPYRLTGLGATTPIGGDLPSTWSAALSVPVSIRRSLARGA